MGLNRSISYDNDMVKTKHIYGATNKVTRNNLVTDWENILIGM